MNELVNIIIAHGKFLMSKEALVFVISMLPVFELRGGMIAGALLDIPYPLTLVLCLIANLLPIPFILLLLNKVIKWMEGWKYTEKFALWLKNKAEKNRKLIDKYGYLGLMIFVAIPLPGSGAWTGALVASVLHMDVKKACITIILGVLIASAVMSLVSYGIIGNIIR